MSTKFQQIGKISLSAVLSIVTVFSTVFCGSFYTVTAETAAAEILGTDNAAADVETVDLNGGVTEETAAAESDNTDTNVSNVDSDILTGKKTTEKVLPQSSGGEDVQYDIYFSHSLNWSNVGVWAWSGDKNFTGGSWPGYKMTKVNGGDYDGLYHITLTINSDYSTVNFIFNDFVDRNGQETATYTIEQYGELYNGRVFIASTVQTNNKYGITCKSLESYKGTSHTVDPYKIYFKNTDSWANVNAHYWNIYNESDDSFFGTSEWPGVAMSKTAHDNIYEIELNEDIDYLTFNNRTSDNGSSYSKKDSVPFYLAYKGKVYNYSTDQWEDYPEPDPNPTPDPEESDNWYIVGRFSANGDSTMNAPDRSQNSGWSLGYTGFQFVDAGNGLYKYVTDQTIAQLSEKMIGKDGNYYEKLFVFLKIDKDDNKSRYASNQSQHKSLTQSQNAEEHFTLAEFKSDGNNQFYFNDPNNTSKGKVTFWLDTTNATPIFYFTVGKTLTITHGQYSEVQRESSYSSKPSYHNGEGTPEVSARILNSSGTEISTHTAENGEITLTEAELNADGAATLEVTLSSTSDSDDVVCIYEDTGTAFGALTTNASLVKTYSISDLNNKTQLNYYTDYKTDVLTVNFKYYNRKTIGNAVEEIDSEATTAVIKGSIHLNKSETIENAIVNALNFENGGVMNSINNTVDEYYFWASTYQATQGIAQRKDYHSKDGCGYKTYGTSGRISDLSYHLNNVGNALASKTNSDKWVTYTTTDGQTLVYKENADSPEPDDLTVIKSITVWGYNAPKLYTLQMYLPPKDRSGLVEYTDFNSGNGITEDKNKVYWYNDKVDNIPCQGFFNQRLGGKDGSYIDTDSVNAATEYLRQYGINNNKSYLGEYTAPPEFVTSGDKTYRFDGWYASKSDDSNAVPVKVSTDLYYQNRITANLKLAAGYTQYTEGSQPTEQVGVSVTDNGIDSFYDGSGVKRVSLNTQVNVYGANDTDTNIQKVAAIYLQLPVKDNNNKVIAWTQSMIDNLGLSDYSNQNSLGYKIDQYVKSLSSESNADVRSADTLVFTLENVNIENYKVISYNYNAAWTDSTDSSTAVLTNKNRLQFSLPMKAEYYEGGSNSAIIAYAAIYYNGEGWILSDNYVPYIYNLSDQTTTTEGKIGGKEETAPD